MDLQRLLNMKNIDRRFIIRILLAVLSGLVAAVNLNSFVAAGQLVPGGFSGLSLLIVRIAKATFNIELNYSTLYILFNIPCTLLVYKSIGQKFTIVSNKLVCTADPNHLCYG